MAYIFQNKEDAVTFLTSLEFSCGSDYHAYTYLSDKYTTRFNIFYKGELSGFVENENFSPNSSNVWVIHIPLENRTKLEASNPGIVEAIFDEGTNVPGTIDKNYYIDPVAFSSVSITDYKNSHHIVTAQGPGSTLDLKLEDSFINVTKLTKSTNNFQLKLDIDTAKLARQLRYDFSDIIEAVATTRISPRDIAYSSISEFPSVIFAKDAVTEAKWESLANIETGFARKAYNSDALGEYKATYYLRKDELGKEISDIFSKNSSSYGFRSLYNEEDKSVSIYAKPVTIDLVGDVSGSGTLTNFNNVQIRCRIAKDGETSGESNNIGWVAKESIQNSAPLIKFTGQDIYLNDLHLKNDEEDNVCFDIPLNKSYKFNIGGRIALEIPTSGGNDLAEMFDSDPDCVYEDGDPLGICEDQLVRPLSHVKAIEYIGICSKNPAILLGNSSKEENKVGVALSGRKRIKVKTFTPVSNLIGRKVIATPKGFGLYSKNFDHECHGVIVGFNSEISDCLYDVVIVIK